MVGYGLDIATARNYLFYGARGYFNSNFTKNATL